METADIVGFSYIASIIITLLSISFYEDDEEIKNSIGTLIVSLTPILNIVVAVNTFRDRT